MNKDQPVPIAKDFEKLKQKLEQRKDESGLSGLRGKAVRIHLRGDSEIEGVIASVQTYELEVTANEKRYIVLKHAVDYIEVVS